MFVVFFDLQVLYVHVGLVKIVYNLRLHSEAIQLSVHCIMPKHLKKKTASPEQGLEPWTLRLKV